MTCRSQPRAPDDSGERGLGLLETALALLILLGALAGGLFWFTQVIRSEQLGRAITEADLLLQAGSRFAAAHFPLLERHQPLVETRPPDPADLNSEGGFWLAHQRNFAGNSTAIRLLYPDPGAVAGFLPPTNVFKRRPCAELDPAGQHCAGNCLTSPFGGFYKLAIAVPAPLPSSPPPTPEERAEHDASRRVIVILLLHMRPPNSNTPTLEQGRRIIEAMPQHSQLLFRQLGGEDVTTALSSNPVQSRLQRIALTALDAATIDAFGRDFTGPCRFHDNIGSHNVWAATFTIALMDHDI